MSYRASATRGSRKNGQSARAKHAYHERLDGYAVGVDGVRDDLSATGCGNLPAFAQGDAAAFWEAADQFERANACLFVDLQFNLPAELTLAEQAEILRAYCERMFSELSLPHSWAIHAGDSDTPNPHAHLMVSERMTDDHERSAEEHFRRYNPKNPAKGGAEKTRELQPKAWLMEARAAWAEEVNRALVAAGFPSRFDHRSKIDRKAEAIDQGNWRLAAELSTLTEQHEGPRVGGYRRRLEREIITWDQVPAYAQRIIESNDLVRAFNQQHQEMIAGMTDDQLRLMLADDIADRARERLPLAERAELAAFEAQEQADHLTTLLAIEREQAHSPALVEAAELAEVDPQPARRARRAGYQQRAERYIAQEFACWDAIPAAAARSLLQARQIEPLRRAIEEQARAKQAEAQQALQAARDRAADLEVFLASPPPPYVDAAELLRAAAERAGRTLLAAAEAAQVAAQAASAWHAANPIRSAAARLTGQPLAVDQTAERAAERFRIAKQVEQRAMAAYEAAPEVSKAARYATLCTKLRHELEELRAALPALVEAAQGRPPALARLWDELGDAELVLDDEPDDSWGRDQPEDQERPELDHLWDGTDEDRSWDELPEIDLGDDDLDDDPTPQPRSRGPRMG